MKRLRTDYIDLYFQHRIDPGIPAEEVAGVMQDLIREGKVLHWGISEADEEYLRRANAVCPVTAVENRYSMMARHYETLFPVLEELGVGFVAFSPMANGLLSGRYGKNDTFDKQYDYRSSMPQFTAEAFEENSKLLALLRETAEKRGNAVRSGGKSAGRDTGSYSHVGGIRRERGKQIILQKIRLYGYFVARPMKGSKLQTHNNASLHIPAERRLRGGFPASG